MIASTAGAENNSLTTGTLTYSDIANSSNYSASSSGFSAGGSIGNSGKATGPASVSGAGGVTPMMSQGESGSQEATTRSAVSAGTITLTDGANQTQDLAGLSRDTTNTNGTVSKAPDVNALLAQQSDMMDAASAAGQVVAQGIGTLSDAKRDAALAAGDKATAEAWEDGGLARTGLHIAGGALVAGLGGGSIGSAAQGAAGAGIASASAGLLNSLADGIGGETGSMLAGNIVSNVLAGAGGYLVGGNAGAFTAANVDLYNRQLHPEEKKAIADAANGDPAEQEKLTRAACYVVKCWAEFAPGSAEYNANYVSLVETAQLGPELDWVNRQQEAGLFNYTPLQKIGDIAKSDPLGVAKDTVKVVVGAVTAKTGVGLCTSGLGCAAGAPMAAFGASDMAEGADGLYNRYNGISSPGTNPLRYGFNLLSPVWGDTAYDSLNLIAAAMALKAPVPLKMGTADGLNRSGSMFDVTVSRINNNTLIPFTGQAAPYGVTQGILLFGVGSKGAAVVNDIGSAGDQK